MAGGLPTEDEVGRTSTGVRVRPLRAPVWLVALFVLVAVGWFLAGAPLGIESGSTPPAGGAPAAAIESRFSTLDVVAIENLPAEARTTLLLIAEGGPFPFARDDSVFQNRERLLPIRDDGHYREYTVVTPGADDRGARRIVAGADGERYYTDDHYSSFREIVDTVS